MEDRLRILYNVVIALLGGAFHFADYRFSFVWLLGTVLGRHGKRKRTMVGNWREANGSLDGPGTDGVPLERVSVTLFSSLVCVFHL